MRITGASDHGWIAVDLSQVARAIAALRTPAAGRRSPAPPARVHTPPAARTG